MNPKKKPPPLRQACKTDMQKVLGLMEKSAAGLDQGMKMLLTQLKWYEEIANSLKKPFDYQQTRSIIEITGCFNGILGRVLTAMQAEQQRQDEAELLRAAQESPANLEMLKQAAALVNGRFRVANEGQNVEESEGCADASTTAGANKRALP